jgi:integrase/recombinase XerD
MSLGWKEAIRNFEIYLRLEKSLSENSIEAYLDDVQKLERFYTENGGTIEPACVTYNDLKQFLTWISENNINPRTQARLISGIKAFYRFL